MDYHRSQERNAMPAPVRVRFAPSPTGKPHVGNIRTAMFNWLMARHDGGTLVLRIEDTDVARRVAGAEEAIMDGLRWLGLDWDEGPDVGGDYGPYYQSERLDLYTQAAARLVEQGDAYYCYCSPERLEDVRKQRAAAKEATAYDRHCRDLTPDERARKEAEGIVPVVRFKVPLDGRTTFNDLIYGDVTFEHGTIDDFVLLKSDGYPTYHLANVVDDSAMKISHVIRAEEWISSTPRHLLIYRALGLEPPRYVHHPMILGPDRAKLSKRHGDVSIIDYREHGYLPETMFNFLALIGWSLDDKTEIMTRQELIDSFSLDRIGKTGAIFNKDKLDWMNGVYIRSLDIDELVRRALPFLEKGLPPEVKRPLDADYIRRMMPLIRERINTLQEAATYAEFFFIDDLKYNTEMLIGKKMTGETSLEALKASEARLSPLDSFDHELLEDTLRPLAEEMGLKAGQLFGVLRTAVTGRTATPPLFETMTVLGKERCLKRIKLAINKLESK
ncbi:MAG: glutamate--tRNA ligase [Dehalococcoidales bacterium]|nr:glutamate--tRNA ligase [Dehalococcoidales bacterium]